MKPLLSRTLPFVALSLLLLARLEASFATPPEEKHKAGVKLYGEIYVEKWQLEEFRRDEKKLDAFMDQLYDKLGPVYVKDPKFKNYFDKKYGPGSAEKISTEKLIADVKAKGHAMTHAQKLASKGTPEDWVKVMKWAVESGDKQLIKLGLKPLSAAKKDKASVPAKK